MAVTDITGQKKRRKMERLQLVRTYFRAGYTVEDIFKKLSSADYFPGTMEWERGIKEVKKDLKLVAEQDKQNYLTYNADAELALREYLFRQAHLYHLALESGDIALAAKLSKDIANVHGVSTGEPIRVEGDLFAKMIGSFPSAEQKAFQNRQQARPLPAPPIPIEARKVEQG